MTTVTAGSSLEHPIGPDGIVKLRLRDGEVRLHAVDGETVRVRERGGRDLGALFSIDLGAGSADLSSGDDRHGGGHDPDIEVDLPHRATVVVETTSAEIEADGLLGDQRYRTTSGEVTLHAVAGRIAVEAVSGDLDIVATADADLVVRTVSGDVEIRAATVRSLTVATTSGDLKLAGHLAGPGPFAIETVSGDGLLRTRRRPADRDDDAVRRPELGHRRPRPGRPRPPLALGRHGRPITDIPLDVR